MTFLPETTNSDGDHWYKRLGHGGQPGGGWCVGLPEPWILWDTRNHDGTTLNKIDNEYGAGDPIVNEGTGPDEWDLEIETFSQGSGLWGCVAYKTLNWPNSFGTSGTNHPDDWPDLGGTPCEGGITWMIAVGEWAQLRNRNEWDGYIECEILCDNDPPNSIYFQVIYIFTPEGDIGSAPSLPEWGSFGGIYLLNTFSEWYPEDSDMNGEYVDLVNTLHVIHFDPANNQIWRWINGVLTVTPWLDWDSLNPIDPDAENWTNDLSSGGCDNDFVAATDTIGELFTYFGEHGPTENFPVVGEAWSPLKGAALFRGCPPSATDLEEWYDYWFPGDDQVLMPIWDEATRQGLANTDSHSADFEVPSGGYTRCLLDVLCSGGGTRFLCEIDVVAGDEITIELGGQGGSQLTGTGGWPDGGTGGSAAGTPSRWAEGGGGATRIYLNGVLVLIAAGNGGRAFRFNLAGGTIATFQGGTPGDPEVTVDGNPGLGTVVANRGLGGTSSAGGDGGDNSGENGDTDGTGQGGDGQANTQISGSDRHSGGGGGGGGDHGGGAGGTAAGSSTAPGAGGAGSHWFDSSVTILDTLLYSTSGGSSSTPSRVTLVFVP